MFEDITWTHLMDSIGPIILLYLVVVIATLIGWIGTLVHQAKRGKWVWFILTLIGIPFILVLYWIVWLFRGSKWKKRK